MAEIVSDRYTLGQRLGSGGMGDVFRGLDQLTNTPVAVKILKTEIATPAMVERFLREGEALRQLNHPNIVKLLDAVQERGRYFLIMELVDGGALDDLLLQTPRLPINQVLNIALDLADALTRAHRLNIIHRDIKPANVLLTHDGMLRLTDFGIARVIGSAVTEAGSVLGTIAYIAPEVLTGAQADARSDIWSMGLMLFEMLAGEHPFKSKQASGNLIQAILEAALPDLEHLRPETPTALVDLINRMVVRDPAERIPRMRLVGAELEAILANETSTAIAETQPTQLVVLIERGSRFETPAATPTDGVRHNLPPQTTPFVGRESEVDEVETLLHDDTVRLLTIVGPGGMGKTRLSLEVASRLVRPVSREPMFEHGIYFIDLAPVTAPEHVVGVVAEALGYAFQQDGRAAQQQLLDYVRGKQMLLLLDNFEHLIAARTFVQDVLQAAPLVKLLVTSREKLSLSTETVYPLSGMSFPAWEIPADALEYGAVKLFMQSAHRVRRDFQLDTDALMYVARICRMVQGTPLGILLAAAWLEVLTPREITEEISRSLDFLETDLHDLPDRQRSLRAVFEYSWTLLSEPERLLFAQFSMFHGGFTRDAALQITGTNLRALTVLVNKSLLRRDQMTGRYEVHELLRQYAEEKLEQSTALDSAQDAYGRYYLDVLVQLTPKLKGFGQLEALNLIDTDFENIRAAWIWAVEQRDPTAIESAMEGLYLYLTFRNRLMDGEQMFGLARQTWTAEGDSPSALAGKVLVRFPQEQPPLALYRAGLNIAEQQGEPAEIAFCQRLVGHWISHDEFNQAEGIPLMETSLRGYQALGDKFYAAQVLDDLGWSYSLRLDAESQRTAVQRSLALRREIGDKIGVMYSLRNLGGASGGYFDTTDHALTYWEEAKRIAYEMNDHLEIAWNAVMQASNLAFKANYDRAEMLLDEAQPHAAEINHTVVNGLMLLLRSAIAGFRDGDYLKAKRLMLEGYPPESPPDLRLSLVGFAGVAIVCGLRDFEGLRLYAKYIGTVQPFGENNFDLPLLLPCALIDLADRGQDARAVELLRAYLKTVITYIGQPLEMGWARRWEWLKQLSAQLEANLSATEYQAALARGDQVTVQELAQEVQIFLGDLLR